MIDRWMVVGFTDHGRLSQLRSLHRTRLGAVWSRFVAGRTGLFDEYRAGKIPDPRPCRGVNANVCVAEGCYGEACVTNRTPDEETP